MPKNMTKETQSLDRNRLTWYQETGDMTVGKGEQVFIGTVLLRGVKDPMVIRAFNLKDLSQNFIVKRIEPCDLRRGENLRFTAIK
jgi:hypothetical protein